MGADDEEDAWGASFALTGLRFLALRTAKTDDMDEEDILLPALEAVRGRGGVSLALAFFLTLNTVRFLEVVDFAADLAALGVLASLLPMLTLLILLPSSDVRLVGLMGVNWMAEWLRFSFVEGTVNVEKADVPPSAFGEGRPRPGTHRWVMMARWGFLVCFAGIGVPLCGRGAAMTLSAVSLEKRTVRRGAGGASKAH